MTEAGLGVIDSDLSAGAVPVPRRDAVCGLLSPVSANVRVPVRVPWTVGVKVTEIVQLAPFANVAGLTGQLLVWAKSLRSMLMLVTVIAELCPFFRVTLWTELVLPCA